MSFNTAMLTMLPAINGVVPHISGSVFGSFRNRPKTNNRHGAVDFNYIGGQGAAANKGLPFVYAPIAGEVTFAGGSYGTVKIKDAEGYSHELLHMVHVRVKAGQQIPAGHALGKMAGKGPNGDFQYQLHVHYQLRKPDGTLIDPVAFWDGIDQVYTAPATVTEIGDTPPEGDEDTHGTDTNHYHIEPASPSGNLSEFEPRQAGVSSPSNAQSALWTNRVPRHEPWPRTLMVDTPSLNAPSDQHEYNVNHNPQFDDSTPVGSKGVNRIEGEEEIIRGKFWRR